MEKIKIGTLFSGGLAAYERVKHKEISLSFDTVQLHKHCQG